ncbi:MAG: 2-oxoacid:acceptor oxidoreductase family protein [Candidatus Omnitrophica bacterium]|nr:2-oxoacid:acceptor oxidoreductase family protein [Candidatus Omnitrophota bacterium]
MTERIIIAGSGGQGVMLLGKVLAESAMREARHVTWLPSYGAEVRGGTANCMVVISDEEIGSPFVQYADSMIVLNDESLRRFGGRLKSRGLLVLNSSLAQSAPPAKIKNLESRPFSAIALELGTVKVANIVALGCFVAAGGIVGKGSVEGVIKGKAGEVSTDIITLNLKALSKGFGLAGGSRAKGGR